MNTDKVPASHFYKDDGDKIKQNWFLYEYANILFSKIAEVSNLATYRKQHSEKDIAAFCVYFSKRMRRGIARASEKKASGIEIDGRYIYEFYPHNSRALTQRLLEAAFEAWNEHFFVCENCPNQCLTDGFEITDMFDNLETTGWPTL
jgi:hypothetical protein